MRLTRPASLIWAALVLAGCAGAVTDDATLPVPTDPPQGAAPSSPSASGSEGGAGAALAATAPKEGFRRLILPDAVDRLRAVCDPGWSPDDDDQTKRVCTTLAISPSKSAELYVELLAVPTVVEPFSSLDCTAADAGCLDAWRAWLPRWLGAILPPTIADQMAERWETVATDEWHNVRGASPLWVDPDLSVRELTAEDKAALTDGRGHVIMVGGTTGKIVRPSMGFSEQATSDFVE